MNDEGDGKYTLDYTISQPGSIDVSFELFLPGLKTDYFDTGVLTYTSVEPEIDKNWG